MEEHVDYQVELSGNELRIVFIKELLNSHEESWEFLDRLEKEEDCDTLVLDMRKVTHVSTHILGMLLLTLDKVESLTKKLVVQVAESPLEDILKQYRFDQLFKLECVS